MESLGCAKNQVDSEVMLGLLGEEGYCAAEAPGQADLIIVNTCGFIESATEESIEAILEMAGVKANGTGKLVVAGCLYQRYGEKLRNEMPEVDAFIGCGELEKIAEVSRAVLGGGDSGVISSPETPKYLYNHKTPREFPGGVASVYVKIAEGCDNRCSYCTIPLLRGGYRSRTIDSVVREVRGLLDRGAKEINLIAQDTTYFGYPETKEEQLTSLLRKLDAIKGKKWLRLLYAHPARITSAVAHAISDSRSVCHYIDMPIQHICDEILKAMGRRGSSDDICRAIDVLRNEIPDMAIRTTLMVGFPGETDKQFEELFEFVQNTRFERLGVFKYSREPDTPAADMGKEVSEDLKEERYEALMREQAAISNELNSLLVGKKMEVLVESEDDSASNTIIGRTYRDAPEVDGFVRVEVKGKVPPIGEFIQVEITKAHDYDLEGELL
jgi:ribosomal protein S12 methylthiotransferase